MDIAVARTNIWNICGLNSARTEDLTCIDADTRRTAIRPEVSTSINTTSASVRTNDLVAGEGLGKRQSQDLNQYLDRQGYRLELGAFDGSSQSTVHRSLFAPYGGQHFDARDESCLLHFDHVLSKIILENT